jgi:3-methyladenine DNA glycosylase AlkD
VQGAAPYYVRMAVAWLLATALAKFPDRTRSFVNASRLPDDVLRLYVRKARESFRTRTVSAL